MPKSAPSSSARRSSPRTTPSRTRPSSLRMCCCRRKGPVEMSRTDFHSNLDMEFGAVSELWSPRVVAAANGQYVKVAKVKGEFVWHAHADEDEFFLVRKGTLIIRYRDRP